MIRTSFSENLGGTVFGELVRVTSFLADVWNTCLIPVGFIDNAWSIGIERVEDRGIGGRVDDALQA